MNRFPIIRLAIILAVFQSVAFGQGWYNQPQLVWKTIETEHFLVHYHQETERSAREAAAVAEKIYGPITDLYNYEPSSKTHVILKDVDDDANGAAYFFHNKIEIWARPLDFDLRGAHRWIRDVMTHEFVHIVQLATSLKFTHRIPALYFQYIDYEDEKRDDVLYGYPNALVSYGYPGTQIPPWFAEGVAQYMVRGLNYSFWDTHRDMILRDRVLHDNLLSWTAMSSFGKRGIGNESAYNQGYALVSYIADRWGISKLRDISEAMASPLAVSMNRAVKKAVGMKGKSVYHDWVFELNRRYTHATAVIRENEVKGEVLIADGTANTHPVWHPTERKFAYLSNHEHDYFGQTELYIFDMATRKQQKIAGKMVSAPVWSPDGTQLYYTARSEPNRNGSRWLDIYRYDLTSKHSTRLTEAERATSPVLINDTTLVYLSLYDGSSLVKSLNLNTDEITTLLTFTKGEYLHSIAVDPDQNSLIVDGTIHHGRKLYWLDLAEGRLLPLDSAATWTSRDDRDPAFGEGGMYYATDASGIHNLYWNGPDGNGAITNVTGGAFMPSVNSAGEVLYSLYEDGGYKIAYLPKPELLPDSIIGLTERQWQGRVGEEQLVNWNADVAADYVEEMSKPFIYPRLTIDYGTVKPGFYFSADEVLNELNIFAGAGANSRGDNDYFLLFEFRKFLPTFYTEIFSVTRNVRQDFDYYEYTGTNDLRFMLLDAVVGGRVAFGYHRFWLEVGLSRFRERIYQTLGGLSGGLSIDYYRGTRGVLRWALNARQPEYGGNMFPTKGWQVGATITAENNNLIDGFKISDDYGTIIPDMKPHHTVRVEVNAKKFIPLIPKRRVALTWEGSAGWLSNQDVDDFFAFFGGGMPGLKGYTFYDSSSVGPNRMLQTATLRIPLFIEQDIPLLHLTLQNASAGFIYQWGDAFAGSWADHEWKSSVGVEFRLNGASFSVFPFALGYEIHRPLGTGEKVYRHYLSLLFDF